MSSGTGKLTTKGDRSHYRCSDAQCGGVSTGDYGAHHRSVSL